MTNSAGHVPAAVVRGRAHPCGRHPIGGTWTAALPCVSATGVQSSGGDHGLELEDPMLFALDEALNVRVIEDDDQNLIRIDRSQPVRDR
jgi:hypothetical protein